MTQPITMRADIREEWLKRLRSGDYQQGRGSLRYDGKHCCLGVLCDIAVDQGFGRWEAEGGTSFYLLEGESMEEGDGKESLPPTELLRWAGVVPTDHPGNQRSLSAIVSMGGAHVSAKLHQLNDGDCGFNALTFAQIADLIEEQITPVPPVESLDVPAEA